MRGYYLLHFLSKAVWGVFYSCSVANMLADGMSLEEASLAFFWLAFFIGLFEIPFGFIADKYGRKISVVSGLFATGLGFSMLWQNQSLYVSAMAFVALGLTFVSGADKAWFVSQHKQMSGSSNSEDFFLNLSLVERGSMVMGAVLGPWIMTENPSWVWGTAALLSFVAAFFGLSLSENRTGSQIGKKIWFQWKDMKEGASLGFFIVVLSGFFYGIAEGGKGIVIQPYIINTAAGFAGILTIHQLLCVLCRIAGIMLYKKVVKNRGSHPARAVGISLVTMMLSAIVALLTSSYIVFMFFFGLSIVALGWGEPLTDSVVNNMIQNQSLKATYFSLRNMITNAGEALSYLYLAHSLVPTDLGQGWRLAAGGFALSVVIFMIGTWAHVFGSTPVHQASEAEPI